MHSPLKSKCATCRRDLVEDQDQIHFVILDYVREWDHPRHGDLRTGLDDFHALTIVCKDCLGKPYTHAVEVRGGEQIFHEIRKLATYQQAMEFYLPDELDFYAGRPDWQVKMVFNELWKAGKESPPDLKKAGFLQGWLTRVLMDLPGQTPYKAEMIGLAIRSSYFEHTPTARLMEMMEQTVVFGQVGHPSTASFN